MAKYDASFIVRLSKNYFEKFNEVLKEDSINRSALVRKWIEEYINENYKGLENMNKTIEWTGKNQENYMKYTAEGKTYKELYENIQEKYGYGNIIYENVFEMKVLEVNNEDVESYLNDDALDFEKYEDWVSDDKVAKVTDEHYREMIEESDAEAYTQTFEIDGEEV